MGTFLLVWTVLFTAVSKVSIAGNLAPIAIGWSVMLAHLVLIPFTGCGINPARSFGPHIVIIMAGQKAGAAGWWIFYTAPFVGYVLVCHLELEAYCFKCIDPNTIFALFSALSSLQRCMCCSRLQVHLWSSKH